MHEVFVNPSARPVVPAAGFAPDDRRPMQTHRQLPDYHPTRLLPAPELATRLGVASVLVKDESLRLGLPSFKILGASWATLSTIDECWLGAPGGQRPATLQAVRGELARLPAERRLVAATDGNHGRGVARMAALLGLHCTILVPAGTASARVDAIAGEGAAVEVVDGSYDEAVQACAALADDHTLVISDTSWGGYERPPRAVIEGYSTMFHEIDDAIDDAGWPQPTLVAVQAGVGAFAAAAWRHYRSGSRPAPRTVVVEPLTANCLMASARAGRPTEVPGPHPSRMAGLNCGLPSPLAWPVVRAGTDTFVAVDDETSYEAMRALAAVGVEAGESGAAGLAGLLALSRDPAQAAAAGLGPQARVVIVNTEGATDPVNYERVLAAPSVQAAR